MAIELLGRGLEHAVDPVTLETHLVRVIGGVVTQDYGVIAGPPAAGAAGGNPVAFGTDAVGTDAYATVVVAPARRCSHLLVELEPGQDAILSLDGGVTDHIPVKGNQVYTLDGLAIAAGALIQGRNAEAGLDYTNLKVTVW